MWWWYLSVYLNLKEKLQVFVSVDLLLFITLVFFDFTSFFIQQSSLFFGCKYEQIIHVFFCALLEHKLGPFGPLKLFMQTFKYGMVWIVDNSNITLSGNLHNSKYQLFWKKCLWFVKYAHFVLQVTIAAFYILGFILTNHF